MPAGVLSRLPRGPQDGQDGCKEAVESYLSEIGCERKTIGWMHIRESIRMKTEGKKKRLLATIWESMTKTGGCCGPGEDCCGPTKDSDKKAHEEKTADKSDN